MNLTLEDKVSILLMEKSVDLHVLKSIEEELEFNEELKREYHIQKTVKSLLCKKLKRRTSIKEKQEEIRRRINLLQK